MPEHNHSQNSRTPLYRGVKTLCLVGGLLAIGLAVGGCGKKGPLYLPDPAEQSQEESSTQTPSKTSEQETQ